MAHYKLKEVIFTALLRRNQLLIECLCILWILLGQHVNAEVPTLGTHPGWTMFACEGFLETASLYLMSRWAF